jgi:hypothetical protein
VLIVYRVKEQILNLHTTAAMKKDKTTAGPATLAASPETTNIPAPIEAPTPTKVTSNLPSVRDNAWVGVVVVEDDENVDWVALLRRRFQKEDGCGACSIMCLLLKSLIRVIILDVDVLRHLMN